MIRNLFASRTQHLHRNKKKSKERYKSCYRYLTVMCNSSVNTSQMPAQLRFRRASTDLIFCYKITKYEVRCPPFCGLAEDSRRSNNRRALFDPRCCRLASTCCRRIAVLYCGRMHILGRRPLLMRSPAPSHGSRRLAVLSAVPLALTAVACGTSGSEPPPSANESVAVSESRAASDGISLAFDRFVVAVNARDGAAYNRMVCTALRNAAKVQPISMYPPITVIAREEPELSGPGKGSITAKITTASSGPPSPQTFAFELEGGAWKYCPAKAIARR